MAPPTVNMRTTLLFWSTTNTRPVLSTATPEGELNVADRAAPPSPLPQQALVPATVVTLPVEWLTIRITRFPVSAMKTSPRELMATPLITEKVARVAAPPSPEYPYDPVPANVMVAPPPEATLRICVPAAM